MVCVPTIRAFVRHCRNNLLFLSFSSLTIRIDSSQILAMFILNCISHSALFSCPLTCSKLVLQSLAISSLNCSSLTISLAPRLRFARPSSPSFSSHSDMPSKQHKKLCRSNHTQPHLHVFHNTHIRDRFPLRSYPSKLQHKKRCMFQRSLRHATPFRLRQSTSISPNRMD